MWRAKWSSTHCLERGSAGVRVREVVLPLSRAQANCAVPTFQSSTTSALANQHALARSCGSTQEGAWRAGPATKCPREQPASAHTKHVMPPAETGRITCEHRNRESKQGRRLAHMAPSYPGRSQLPGSATLAKQLPPVLMHGVQKPENFLM